MSDKDEDIGLNEGEDASKNDTKEKRKKRQKKNKKKQEKGEENVISEDDVYDISPAKDTPWCPSPDSDDADHLKKRKSIKKVKSEAMKKIVQKSPDAASDSREKSCFESQRIEIEMSKSTGRTTTRTGIDNTTTRKGQKGRVNLISVQPVQTSRELHNEDVPAKTDSSTNILNDLISVNVNGQSSKGPYRFDNMVSEMNGEHLYIPPSGVENTGMFIKGETGAPTYDQYNSTDRKQKKKGAKKKKKKKKKTKLSEFEKEYIKHTSMISTAQTSHADTPRDKHSDKPAKKRIIVDPNGLLKGNEKENFTTENEFQTTESSSHINPSLSPVIEDIEDTIENEFNDRVDCGITTAADSMNQTPLASIEDTPIRVSELSFHCDCRSCVGEVSADNRTNQNRTSVDVANIPPVNDRQTYQRTNQRIGRFRRFLKFFTSCFSSKVED